MSNIDMSGLLTSIQSKYDVNITIADDITSIGDSDDFIIFIMCKSIPEYIHKYRFSVFLLNHISRDENNNLVMWAYDDSEIKELRKTLRTNKGSLIFSSDCIKRRDLELLTYSILKDAV